MIPMHRYMDSHPFQKNQMPFGSYRYPSMESDPSYMMMDPAKSCMPLHDSGRNCWPYGYPMPSYSYCNGGNFFPGYYNFRPPHLPVPPHQHMHFYGRYPPYSEPYMPNVFPPHYNVEQPRYEFDKNMMRNHHCCGCPKSLFGQNQNQKEDGCLKIEEEKPDNQRLGSLVPFQLGNNQSPIVWIPPDYIESKKEREPFETRTLKQDKECHSLNSTENLKAVEKAPKFWNGWPLSDMSRLGSWLPDAEGMGIQSGQNKQQEDGNEELPFPVVWMPPFGRPEGARKGVQNMDAPTNYSEEPSNVRKLLPTNILQKDDASSEGPEVVKTVNQSNIPEMDVNNKTEDTNKKKERRCIKVETVEHNKERKPSKIDIKGQSSTSPKKLRLPPVCLRVDPLPKEKSVNGSSRSQSPLKSTAIKESSRLDSKINSGMVEPNSEKIIKEVEVKSRESLDGYQGDKENISRPGAPLISPRLHQEKVFDKLCKEKTEEIASEEHMKKDGTISQAYSRDLAPEEGKNEKPDLSDVEAALLIQSAYRGYKVRKWELLTKMKQLADVRQQVIEVHNRVKALELAPRDEKEKVFIGEMIMRLLLKLDAIQGLHPSAREFRKSLAKELVALQEKLDCMVTKPTEVLPETSMEKHVDVPHDDLKVEEQHKDDVVVIKGDGGIDDVADGENESNSLLGESDGAQRLCGVDGVAGSQSVMASTDKELQKPSGDGYSELPEVNDENTKVEAEQLVEVTEPEVRNEDTWELSSHDSSKHLEGMVRTSLTEDKRPEQAALEDVELVTYVEQRVGEVLQTDKQEESVNYQAPSLEDVNPAEDPLEIVSGEQVREQAELTTPQVLDKIIEDHLAADMELPMRENNNPNSSEADKLEHIDMGGDVPETEENAYDLKIELDSDGTLNEKRPEGQEEFHVLSVISNGGASEGFAESPVDQSNSKDDLNIQNERLNERNEQHVEEVQEDMQHQPLPSSELHRKVRRTCDESAELLEELPKPDPNENIENETPTVKDERQIAGFESNMELDILQEPCVVDLMPSSSKLETEDSKLYVAEETTPDGTSVVTGEEPQPALPNASQEMMNKHDLGTEKEIDKKLVEENEKMREMVAKLMEAGKEQIAMISKLSRRVKNLEERLARKKKLRRGCGLPTPRYPMLNGPTKFEGI